MFRRDLVPLLTRLAAGYPVLVLTGARQTGKTTLAQAQFPDRPYVNLEDLGLRAAAAADPAGFLARFPDGAVLDEVQRAPELFPALQVRVDADRRMGRWILTGSQQFGLIGGLTQSLAGRAALIELHPFTSGELLAAGRDLGSWDDCAWRGGYPPLFDRPVAPADWISDYLASYLERDVRQLTNVRDLGVFRTFLRLTATRTGQLLNLSALATEAGITQPTAQAWITVLEASHLVLRLRPWHRNIGKRLVKMPKLYWLDTGLCAHLLGLTRPEHLATHPLRGALFETWVVSDLIRSARHRRDPAAWWFFRTSQGHEVDLVRELGGRLTPIEIKAGTTFAADWLDGLRSMRDLVGATVDPGLVVHGGALEQDVQGVRVVPWQRTAALAAAS